MGLLSSILGFCGFGLGTSIGLVIGYYMFIYFQPADVKVGFYFPVLVLSVCGKSSVSSMDLYCQSVLCVEILF